MVVQLIKLQKESFSNKTARAIQKKGGGIPSGFKDNRPLADSQKRLLQMMAAERPDAPIQRRLIGEAGGDYKLLLQRKLGTAQEYVDRLLQEIVKKMGKEDRVVKMALDPDADILIVLNPEAAGELDTEGDKIILNPNIKAAGHESRKRLFNESDPESADYSTVGFQELKKEGTVVGRLSLATTLYHELGHFFQKKVLKIDFSSYKKDKSGQFLIELHNILQSENRMAVQSDEPLRSTYRSPDLNVKDAPEIGTKYRFGKRSFDPIKEPEADAPIGHAATARATALVRKYEQDLLGWVEQHGKGLLTEGEIRNIQVIFRDAVDVVGDNMRESQLHILQGIVDSAYHYVLHAQKSKKSV